MTQVKSQNASIRTLQLKGLDIAAGRGILRDYGLEESDNSEALALLSLWCKMYLLIHLPL